MQRYIHAFLPSRLMTTKGTEITVYSILNPLLDSAVHPSSTCELNSDGLLVMVHCHSQYPLTLPIHYPNPNNTIIAGIIVLDANHNADALLLQGGCGHHATFGAIN